MTLKLELSATGESTDETENTDDDVTTDDTEDRTGDEKSTKDKDSDSTVAAQATVLPDDFYTNAGYSIYDFVPKKRKPKEGEPDPIEITARLSEIR